MFKNIVPEKALTAEGKLIIKVGEGNFGFSIDENWRVKLNFPA